MVGSSNWFVVSNVDCAWYVVRAYVLVDAADVVVRWEVLDLCQGSTGVELVLAMAVFDGS